MHRKAEAVTIKLVTDMMCVLTSSDLILKAGSIELYACLTKGKVPQFTIRTEMATLHAGSCTRSRVITYSLDSRSWIHGAMHVR